MKNYYLNNEIKKTHFMFHEKRLTKQRLKFSHFNFFFSKFSFKKCAYEN